MSYQKLEHTITLTVPTSLWPLASEGIRGMRQILKDAGGTSRLTRKGDTLTYTARGPVASVLNSIDGVRKVGEMVRAEKAKVVDGLMSKMGPEGQKYRGNARVESVLNMAADILLDRATKTKKN